MKYSYDWLKELSGTKLSPEKLADLLTMRSFEVEEIKKAEGKLNDIILDLDILSNRGHDALSHIGIAREICALENKKFDYDYKELKMPSAKTDKIKVEIQNKELCSRYIGAVMENIEIKESPDWIKTRLVACGISSINNVVDATNYVMLELGQPTHCFDFSKIKTIIPTIFVRKAKKGEEIKLLDESVVELSTDDLVIADNEKALAIAGIKGGLDAEITNETKTIILEAANFNSLSVRKTRIRLGLKTESSDRFEKELDPNLAEEAMARLIEIISETAGGELRSVKDIYPKKVLPWKIKLDLNYLNNLLGEEILDLEALKILKSLGIKPPLNLPLKKGERVLEVEIPTFRIDLRTQEDLIEEVGRIYGYEKIKSQAPIVSIKPAKINDQKIFERTVKNILTSGGFSEIYNYSFYSFKDAELAGLEKVKHLELENPMNPEQALMKISLIPSLLKNIENNLKNYKEFSIFEIGRVYYLSSEILPEEKRMLVGAIVLEEDKKAESFYLAKGCVDNLFLRLGITGHYYDDFKADLEKTFKSLWHKTRSAEIKVGADKKLAGYLGEINPFVLEGFGIHQRVVMFEFDLEELREISEAEREYKPISKFPAIVRDISMIVNEDIRISDVLMNIQASGGNLVLDVDLFDIFENEKEGVKSLAFHIIFGSDKRTLENKEADGLMEKIIADLERELKVKVRK